MKMDLYVTTVKEYSTLTKISKTGASQSDAVLCHIWTINFLGGGSHCSKERPHPKSTYSKPYRMGWQLTGNKLPNTHRYGLNSTTTVLEG